MTFRYLWQKFDSLMNEPQCQKIFGLCTSHVLVCSPRKVKFWYLPCIFHISIIDAHKIQIYVRYFGQECALNSEDMQLCIPCTSYVQVNKMENNLISRAAFRKMYKKIWNSNSFCIWDQSLNEFWFGWYWHSSSAGEIIFLFSISTFFQMIFPMIFCHRKPWIWLWGLYCTYFACMQAISRLICTIKVFMTLGVFCSTLTAKFLFFVITCFLFVCICWKDNLFSPYQCLYDFWRLWFDFHFDILLLQFCRLVRRVQPCFVDGVSEI